MDSGRDEAKRRAADVVPSLPRRALVLVSFGLVVASVLAVLQRSATVTRPSAATAALGTFAVWGTCAVLLGLLYPWVDQTIYGSVHGFKRDWPNAIRCVAILIGIHQASTKLPFSNYYELGCTLGFLAIGLWWMADRSTAGFVLAPLLSSAAAVVTMGTEPTLSGSGELYLSRWCISYCACVTFGTIGRILAVRPSERTRAGILNMPSGEPGESPNKPHND